MRDGAIVIGGVEREHGHGVAAGVTPLEVEVHVAGDLGKAVEHAAQGQRQQARPGLDDPHQEHVGLGHVGLDRQAEHAAEASLAKRQAMITRLPSIATRGSEKSGGRVCG